MNRPAAELKPPHVPTWLLVLLVVTAVAAQAGRILTARASTGETPFHSANDRSRWCSVAALGGYGQFEIDPFLEIRDAKTKRRTWYTIDLVRHRGRDGKQHYYSSKPPLLSAMHAAVYAAVRAVTGLSLVTQTFVTARIILVLVNLLPLAGFWWLWGRYWQRRLTVWAFTILMVFMLWGTFVSTFANTLNNHLPGALSAGLSLWAVLQIVEQQRRELRWFVLAAASAAMAAVCELPALSWVAAVSALLVQVSPKRAVVGLVLGMLPLAVASAGVNYLAHGDLKPPYAHRGVGELIAQVPQATTTAGSNLEILSHERNRLIEIVREHGYQVSNQATVQATRTSGVEELWDEATQYRFALVARDGRISIHQWDDWYDYPNSYWYPDRKKGVDRGEPSRAAYLFHTTIGHHGIFSLTPMWLLLPLGIWSVWSFEQTSIGLRIRDLQVQLMLAIVATSCVCFAFYMLRPLEDRNYGGVSSGFRWMFWFTPLWCWLLAHALERVRSRLGRGLVLVALAASIYSANIPWSNPWTAPWLMQFPGLKPDMEQRP